MVKKVGRRAEMSAMQPPKTQKIALQLERIKTKITNLMDKRGTQILGAGKPPVVTDHAPSQSKKLVAQAASTVFYPKIKKHK